MGDLGGGRTGASGDPVVPDVGHDELPVLLRATVHATEVAAKVCRVFLGWVPAGALSRTVEETVLAPVDGVGEARVPRHGRREDLLVTDACVVRQLRVVGKGEEVRARWVGAEQGTGGGAWATRLPWDGTRLGGSPGHLGLFLAVHRLLLVAFGCFWLR